MENEKILFSHEDFTLKRGESWAVVGMSEYQKSCFVKMLGKKIVDVNEIIEKDREDDAFINEENFLNPGQKASDLLPANCEYYLEKFNLRHIYDTSIRHLSTGEIAKILLASAISENSDVLFLNEPFDGLDAESRVTLLQIIDDLTKNGVCVVMFLNRIQDVPQNITHKKFMNDDLIRDEKICQIPPKIDGNIENLPENLAILRNVNIKYGEKLVLQDLNWTVKKGEHWKITGPNGCGKSTLLSLISGDNPQSFANDITLFGRKRGSGETIWDVKKNIGIVSNLFHRDYRVSTTALETVISGFHDTIGIYRKPSPAEIETSLLWLELAEIKDGAKKRFKNLSYGEQRLILIIRAMVKHPPILILDEPCFGLETNCRKLTLDFIEILVKSGKTTILFVSHHEDDFVEGIKNRLEFVKSNENESGYFLKFWREK
ncbi:MAG: ATP-binding cassette domain-containing protein [Chitinivibrionia bacterium]|nr:ATP-binding cassette domain-containing protein [Chitinivibrionia bacterium]